MQTSTLNQNRLNKKRKKRMAKYIIIGISGILLAPEVAYIIHQLLLGKIKNINYFLAIQALISTKQVQQLYVILLLLVFVFILYLSMDMQQKIAKVDTYMLTPDIELPVSAGNGQHGNARFLNKTEKAKLYGRYEFATNTSIDKMPEIPGKGGLVVQYEKIGSKEVYYYIGKDWHSLVVSTSGGGKSRSLLMPTLTMQLQSGMSVVVTDVKGELWCYTADYAKEKGYKVVVLDFRNPRRSMHYNLMQPILDALKEGDEANAIEAAWDLVSVLVGEPKGEPLWNNGESASIAAGILAVATEAPEECRNLSNVYYFLSYMCQPDGFGKMPITKYFGSLAADHPARTCFAMAELAPGKTRGSFFTSALGTLKLFVNPNIASMTSRSDINLLDIGKEKTILYMKIPDEKKTYYPLVSLLVTQIYMSQVAVANENGQRLPVCTDYDLDEIGNCPMIPVLPQIITAGRSRGIRVHLFVQDYQQLQKYKDDAETIISNCALKVFLKGDSDKTLKSISESLGKYTVEVSGASTSISDGKKMNTNYSSSSNLTGRNLLEPAEIKRIKPPHTLVMITGEYPAMNYLPDISQTKINDLYGMGDEEHNRQLIMERENALKETFTGKPKLWGIWETQNSNKDLDDLDEEEEAYFSKPGKTSFINLGGYDDETF
jgi:type IV secretion system protein VirD4